MWTDLGDNHGDGDGSGADAEEGGASGAGGAVLGTVIAPVFQPSRVAAFEEYKATLGSADVEALAENKATLRDQRIALRDVSIEVRSG